MICNSPYTEKLVRPRARKTWLIRTRSGRSFLIRRHRPGSATLCTGECGGHLSRKRQLELLDVAEALHRQGLKFEFRFIGFTHTATAAYTEAFRRRIKPMEAAGYARYGGSPGESGLHQWYDTAAGMVHFPTEDAARMVVLEGLGRDLKFFGARVGGIVDSAGPMPAAELFAPDDWPGLTAAIARWIENGCPPPAGAAALMRERYHPEVFARQHLKVYHEALNTCS